MSLADLQRKKDELSAVEAEIVAEERKFDAAVAGLRERKDRLEAELAAGLRAELSEIEGSDAQTVSRGITSRGKIDEKKILAAVKKHPGSAPAGYIMGEIGGSAVGVSPASLSQKLRRMVEDGQLVREGDKRGTKYRVPEGR